MLCLMSDKLTMRRLRELVLYQEKVQIKHAFLRVAYPVKASVFSSNAA